MAKEEIEKAENVGNKEKKGKKEKKVKLKSDLAKARARNVRLLKLIMLIIAIMLIIIYFMLRIAHESGAFTVVLNQDFARQNGIIMYENLEIKEVRSILVSPRPEVMDNISIKWLPENINDEADGSHNGENHIAYTFYVENEGIEVNYWYSILIDDVIKDVDEAVRVMVYLNGESTLYAKIGKNGQPERDTIPFLDSEHVFVAKRESFQFGDIDKFTVVIWIEGDDPDCLDPLIGGEMKMHMEITDERINNPKSQQ